MKTIKIATDFGDAPGARYRDDGPKSGQEFFEDILEPRFKEALDDQSKLHIDFDSTWGYATSFISEAFGRLSSKYGAERCLSTLELKSEEDPKLINYVKKIIQDPNSK